MQVRRHPHEDDRLSSLRSYKILDTAPDEAFDALTRLAARVLQAPVAVLSLTDAHRQWFLSRYGIDETEMPLSEAVCSDTGLGVTPVMIADLRTVPRYADLSWVSGPRAYRAYAGVPLIGRDGLPLGSLCVVDTAVRCFGPAELAVLQDLAEQAVSLLELRRSDEARGLSSPELVPEARQPLALRHALDNDEFVPHFQPIVDLRTSRVIGLEALVRWDHPTRGLLPPAAFLPGLDAGSFGSWTHRVVVEAACRLAVDLRARGVELEDGIAVNVSARDLTRPGLLATILDIVLSYDLPPTALTLEITEGADIGDLADTRSRLLLLRAAGMRVIADDFGVGWSNLVRLLQLPLTGLKIDRELVTGMIGDPVRDQMVASAVELASTMGSTVTAEGVETTAVRDRLLELGCIRGQGWLFGRELPAAEILTNLGDVSLRPRSFEAA